MADDDGGDDGRIVLHEDKKYYSTALEVYGEDVETTVQEEDSQPITQPIIAPVKAKDFDFVEKKIPKTVYKPAFLQSLMAHANLVRNVAVVGHHAHGKTTLVDNLVGQTHCFDEARQKKRDAKHKEGENERYTDSRVDEQKRGLSIKATPVTLLLQTLSEKHHLVNLIDTPGHTNFADEVTAALRLADGALLVVDAVEGVCPTTDRLIRHVIAEKLPIVLCVNKIDRLILELKLPPADAFFKLRQVIEEVNTVIREASAATRACRPSSAPSSSPPPRRTGPSPSPPSPPSTRTFALRPRRGARPAVGRRLLPSGFAHLFAQGAEGGGPRSLCSLCSSRSTSSSRRPSRRPSPSSRRRSPSSASR